MPLRPGSFPLRALACSALLALGLLPLGLAACAPARVGAEGEALDRAVTRARADLARRPNDTEVRRDLGALLAQTERFDEAEAYLRQAYVDAPGDPKTLYYLGLALEAGGDPGEALRFYGRFTQVSPRSAFRPLLQGRYEWLARERLREEMAALVAREDTLAAEAGSPRVVAVFPFAYLGSDPAYAPLGRGLAELVTADLAGIAAVQVVERLRLQALLDELALSQSDAFDPGTAPRLGRLLRAGRAVGGSFDVDDDALRVDAALWTLGTEPQPDLQTRTAGLDQLFRLKQQIVLALVEELGVPLSREERAALDVVPTRNLQAFLLYARGLQEDDEGDFGAAARSFGAAAALDPGFGQAVTRAGRSGSIATAGGPVEKGLSAALGLERTGGTLVGSRLRKLNATLGGAFVPGDESRNPAGEGASGSGLFEPLPDPPPPPPSGGN